MLIRKAAIGYASVSYTHLDVYKRQAVLEAETDKLEALCEKPVPEKLTGKSRLAAEIDIARTVARRTERCLAPVSYTQLDVYKRQHPDWVN